MNVRFDTLLQVGHQTQSQLIEEEQKPEGKHNSRQANSRGFGNPQDAHVYLNTIKSSAALKIVAVLRREKAQF